MLMNKETYPILPLRDIVVYPKMIVPLFVGREKSIRCHEVKEWCMAYMEKMAEPPHSRRCRQLPSRGAEKPLLEERCPKCGAVASVEKR